MRRIVIVTIAWALGACGGATTDEWRAPKTAASASIEAPGSIDQDMRAAGISEGAGGERLAQLIFDGGTSVTPPSVGVDAGGLPFGPPDAGVPPIGIADSGTASPFARDGGVF